MQTFEIVDVLNFDRPTLQELTKNDTILYVDKSFFDVDLMIGLPTSTKPFVSWR